MSRGSVVFVCVCERERFSSADTESPLSPTLSRKAPVSHLSTGPKDSMTGRDAAAHAGSPASCVRECRMKREREREIELVFNKREPEEQACGLCGRVVCVCVCT